jgi:hypothetical protein
MKYNRETNMKLYELITMVVITLFLIFIFFKFLYF